ncbi:MAG: hypothetical protein M9949_06015 [Candidatus Kapabacteria bacterium]|nr:hypothetical protein [Candidatus Kapabacteria bacterium]
MFRLELFDRIGNKLNLGDYVKISDGKDFKFYVQVQYLEKEKCIVPFHTFSFHSFEKVDSVPENAYKMTDEGRYDIWCVHPPEADNEAFAASAKEYLSGWRQCEHLLEKGYFRVELN